MKIVYCLHKSIGIFPHILPYFKKYGGLIFTTDVDTAIRFRQEYPGITVSVDLLEIYKYNPDIMMYGDYTPIYEIDAKTVMVFHGYDLKGYYAIKRDWNLCEHYDLCLLYGERLLKEFKANGWNPKYEIIGLPRLDDIEKIPKLFYNNRKTILIAPTWSNESLLERFTDQIIELSKEYNVILKLHSLIGTSRDCNGESMKKIKNSDTLQVFNNSDILPFMKDTDMLLTDYSGTSIEYMHFNKPIIICDPKIDLPKPDTWDVCTVCEDPKTLKEMVKIQLVKDEMKEQRNKYFKNLVYRGEGTATERGMKAIEKLVEEK